MKTTTITNSDGSKTVITTRNQGCTGCGFWLAILFVLGAPAVEFPRFWAVVTYIVIGVIAVSYVLGLIATKAKEKA